MWAFGLIAAAKHDKAKVEAEIEAGRQRAKKGK